MRVDIPEKYVDLYVKALNDKKKQLEKKIEEFSSEIKEINNQINHLTSLPIFQEQTSYLPPRGEHFDYLPAWSWTKKITFYEKLKNKLITTHEIVDFILSKEPHLIRSKVRSSISAALSNRVKYEKYRKFTDAVTGIAYYGKRDWFNPAGQPKIENLPEDVKANLLKGPNPE